MSEHATSQSGVGIGFSRSSFDAKAFLASVSERPGVYQMFDRQGQVIYVGKARNLKNRLSSYFRGNQAIKTQKLVERIAHIETTVTRSEAEALLLEANLIKTHRPRYNILLRDDKSYPWIFASTQDNFPRLAYHRGPRKKAGRYFGPYPSAGKVRETLNLLEKVFKVRQCEDSVFKNRTRPCLQYQIERCKAPCVGYVSQEEYQQDVDDTLAFLSGNSQQLIDDLVARMDQSVAALDFEQAAQLRDQIAALRAVSQQQNITANGGEADVIALERQADTVVVAVGQFRDGQFLGTRSYFPQVPLESSAGEILSAFIAQFYADRPPPARIIANDYPEDVEPLLTALSQQRSSRVEWIKPQRGRAVQLLDDVLANARLSLEQRLQSRKHIQQRFDALGQWIGHPDIRRIECFDISHTQGELTVASCVVFTPEGAAKDQYRRYHIENITPGDDYAAMHQALRRRFDRALAEDGPLPDVLLIDGGRGQLNQAIDVLSERDLAETVLAIGVAKGAERRVGAETLLFSGGREAKLAIHDPGFHLIQQVRDEAHRFAIAGHRARRQKARTQSDLEKIPGIGEKRRQALLKYFGGIRGLKAASEAELAKVPGISPTLARKVHGWFHQGGE